MRIAGLQKLTLLDYPGRTAATVFLPGCNFRCPFCHNAELVVGGDTSDDVSVDEFFAFLDKRHGLLDGVCITGGEPLLQPDLADFCARIKQKGFAVKLDTNGSFPDRLREMVEAELVDYVAMDIKNTRERYGETAGVTGIDLASVQDSIDFLRGGHLPYEFRTTVVRELHAPSDLVALARWIEGAAAWYLQSFVDADSVLTGPGMLHAYEPAELEALLPKLHQYVPRAQLRGV
ncbi:MAG: anaerobic ribonucleoside-triphosphate reductase activating protein [Gordonibacter sp.]|uniref:anaerobic ribonucleoside-triphosphate reductase activating protein n=1 Tax=Gordonibacter sp. TaxID=1968902 RepID=UPI002FCB1382